MTSPVILDRSAHTISRSEIDPDVVRVLYRLQSGGFKAYLVGGSVRDLLLGRKPKDFDVGTDAHPNQVKSLFRNCRIIGRRFRLAHILFARGKTVEVSTFRRRPEPTEGGEGDLLLTEDNTFGTPIEDALRRDFTINGLFYDISTFSVIDYVGGLADLGDRVVRAIGDPDVRFREDPVRMLRAVEFAARLDFTLTLDAHDAIIRHRPEIARSSPPRVTEEILGVLRGPRPLASFRLLRDVGLLELLLPELLAAIAAHTDPIRGEDGTLFWRYLSRLEQLADEGRPISHDSILIGLLVLPLVFSEIGARIAAGGELDNPALLDIIDRTADPIFSRLTIPNAVLHTAKQAIFLLGKLDEPLRSPALARRLIGRSCFPTAFEMFRVHAEASGRHAESVARWERLLAQEPRIEIPSSPRPMRPASHPAPTEPPRAVSVDAPSDRPAPSKRRRRSRSPRASELGPEFKFRDEG
jgi:poly(A) polymerase